MKINNRWFQLCASLVAMIMIANLQYAWTLFVKPMQASTHWKLSDIQFAFTLFILFQTWVQPLDGWLIDRLGPRGFISAAGLLCGLGWAGLGYATSLPICAAIGASFSTFQFKPHKRFSALSAQARATLRRESSIAVLRTHPDA